MPCSRDARSPARDTAHSPAGAACAKPTVATGGVTVLPYVEHVVRLVLEQGYRATSAEQASAAMQAVFGVGTVSIESRGSLQYRQWSLVDDGISATHVESSNALIRVDAAPAPEMVVIAVRSGYLVLEQGVETVALQPGDLGLVPLQQAIRASWEQVEMDLYSFPRSSLNYLLSARSDQIALHVQRRKAVSPALVRLWTRTATSFTDEVLANPELVESDMIREQAIEALLGLTIEAFGISNAAEDETDDQNTWQRATAYMRDNLAKSISVTDVARAVGVSVRGVQLVFQRAGSGTPLAYLRALRMTAAREALTTATEGGSVTDIAQQVGYSNIGRFDAHYYDAFNTLPEEHLTTSATPPAAPH